MRRGLIVALLLLAVIAAYWWRHARSRNLAEAYVGERSATLWSSLAQVKQPVATLRYGEKVAVLEHKGEQVRIRTAQDATGWLEARLLMEPTLWQRSARLLAQAQQMPVQARGHTRTISNVHIEPGRTPSRIYQFSRGTPVEVLSRAAAEWSSSTEENQPAAKEASAEEQKPRREDWLLVRGLASTAAGPGAIESAEGRSEELSVSGKAGESIPVAGWVLGRFLELDLPSPIRDYTSSAAMRVVAWFELNRVPDESGEKPQYLVAGVRGSEGQPCDFSMIRVYTWGATRKRYETAYLESNFCARLPIRVAKAASGEPEFHFSALGKSGYEERAYRMRQTVVRRVRPSEHASARRRR